MVKKWIEREAIRIEKNQRESFSSNLYKFSVELAVHFYNNSNNGYLIHHSQLDEFARNHNITLSKIQMQSKSLLNRNANGYYKFSHKSILEYFLLIKYAQDYHFAKDFDFERMSQTKAFYEEYCKAIIGNDIQVIGC